MVRIVHEGEVRAVSDGGVARCLKLGRIVATPGALTVLSADEIGSALDRHKRCDWGDLGDADKRENDFSFGCSLRILSAYHAVSGVKFWIITEADRSATTILLPDEY